MRVSQAHHTLAYLDELDNLLPEHLEQVRVLWDATERPRLLWGCWWLSLCLCLLLLPFSLPVLFGSILVWLLLLVLVLILLVLLPSVPSSRRVGPLICLGWTEVVGLLLGRGAGRRSALDPHVLDLLRQTARRLVLCPLLLLWVLVVRLASGKRR